MPTRSPNCPTQSARCSSPSRDAPPKVSTKSGSGLVGRTYAAQPAISNGFTDSRFTRNLGNVVMDLDGLTFMDGAAWLAVMAWEHRVRDWGRDLRVVNVPGRIRRIFELTETEYLLAEAVASDGGGVEGGMVGRVLHGGMVSDIPTRSDAAHCPLGRSPRPDPVSVSSIARTAGEKSSIKWCK